MSEFSPSNLVTISLTLPASMLSSVYALLGGATALDAIGFAKAQMAQANIARGSTADTGAAREIDGVKSSAALVSGTDAANNESSELDADGHPWSENLHASTKAKTGAGLWRMKPGATRPAPMPGFPKDQPTGTSEAGAGSNAGDTAPAPATDEEDEFAAFTAAANSSNATDAAAAASVTARKWSDGDLSKLCNEAATKLGDPAPVKVIIAKYTPAGEVPHSRHIPDDKREAFAQEIEAKAGIEFSA